MCDVRGIQQREPTWPWAPSGLQQTANTSPKCPAYCPNAAPKSPLPPSTSDRTHSSTAPSPPPPPCSHCHKELAGNPVAAFLALISHQANQQCQPSTWCVNIATQCKLISVCKAGAFQCNTQLRKVQLESQRIKSKYIAPHTTGDPKYSRK